MVYIIGSEERETARTNRTGLLARAERDLERIARGLSRRPAKDRTEAERRVAHALRAGRMADYLRTELSDDGRSLRWWREESALARAARRDGLYALVTNLSLQQACASRLLELYKAQTVVEQAHRTLKGPLLVRPVFLHSNRRAAALVAISAYALMVYGLVEATVRRAIAAARTLKGLLPEERAARPTAANIFGAFAHLGFHGLVRAWRSCPIPDTHPTAHPQPRGRAVHLAIMIVRDHR